MTGKTLVVLGVGPGPDVYDKVATGEMPRQDYLEIAARLGGDIESYTQAVAARGKWFERLFGTRPIMGSVISAFLRRNAYTHIFTTGEDIGLPLAFLLRAAGWRGNLVMVFHKCISPRRKKFLKFLGPNSFAHLICVSEAQKRIVVELGFPSEEVTAVLNSIDAEFFDAARVTQPQGTEDYIFSCGLENRNYPLLCKAAETLPYKFRIAASGFNSLSGFQEDGRPTVPANVTLETRLTFDELRQNYADARFVILPVNDVAYAAGVTGLVEAMAMGKAVIVTNSVGIGEYIVPGISALVVPPNDPGAMAAAIQTLWNDPARCAEMGRHNRAWIERAMRIDLYCDRVAAIIAAS